MKGMRREKPKLAERLFTLENGNWRDFTPADEGGEHTYVQVKKLGLNHYTIECDQYYSSNGVCKLELTQDLRRALATFKAVLAEDSKQEDEACTRYQTASKPGG